MSIALVSPQPATGKTLTDIIREHIANGLAIIPIPGGSKGPATKNWQLRSNAWTAAEQVPEHYAGNVGLAHAWSEPPTMAIDFDDYSTAHALLADRGIDADVLLTSEDAVQIRSGRENRAKLIYRLPEGVLPFETTKVVDGENTIIELRCANAKSTTMQDVLPPSIHPDTGAQYAWAGLGDPANIPTIDSDLLTKLIGIVGAFAASPQKPPAGTEEPSAVVVSAETVADLRSALAHLRADDRDLWIRVGHALCELGGVGRGLWIDWSQTSAAWKPADARKWDGFRHDKTGYKAVFAMAQAMGWVNPATTAGNDAKPGTRLDEVAGLGEFDHPLTRFIDISTDPKPSRWIAPGLVQHGVCVVAGSHGSGKTTAIVPLALSVAGIHETGYVFAPAYWRHVIYVAEDTEQAERIIAGYVRGIGADIVMVHERFHLVSARRMPAAQVVQVGATYVEQFTRTVTAEGGNLAESVTIDLPPLVIFDTLPATIHLNDENSNAEASDAIAAIKQQFSGLPVWLIGHISKSSFNKKDAMSLRGASAWEADANQVLYITKEDDGSRWVALGKRRFEAKHVELPIQSSVINAQAVNEFGQREDVALRYGIVKIPECSRQAQRAQVDAARQAADTTALRTAILDAVEQAHAIGRPLSKTSVAGHIRRQKQECMIAIDTLVDEGWLHFVEVPRDKRLNPAKKSFLVCLTDLEHDELMSTGALPPEKLAIPPSWSRPDSASSQDFADAGTTGSKTDDDAIYCTAESASSQSASSLKEKTAGTSGIGQMPRSPAFCSSQVPGTAGTSGN